MKRLIMVWDSILVYVVTLLGVLLSLYLPLFKTGQQIDINLKWGQLIVASVLALLFVLQDEASPSGVDGEAARRGKRKNLRRRLAHGIMQGVGWSAITS